MNNDKQVKGVSFIVGAYIIWGFLPLYWRLVEQVPAGVILSHRILWSFVLMISIVLFSGRWADFLHTLKSLLKNKRQLIGISVASIVVSLNWLTYIWAVNNGHVVEASLGYYINPLVSIIFGIVVLKENVSSRQIVSFIIAAFGVVILTYNFGSFPWIACILAFSFAIYGLLKKLVDVEPMFGLTIETMLVTPIAVIYLLTTSTADITAGSFFSLTTLLLIGAGFATAIPLLLFAHGAKKIPLAMLGFLQYIAPTLMLFIGIFVFKESFSLVHFIAFAFIWLALFIYLSELLPFNNKQNMMLKNK